ncbi:MAG TPA: HEAT repeat domain-containing protein [Gemmataceae bacterium]
MSRLASRFALWLLALALLSVIRPLMAAEVEDANERDDEETLHLAGLDTDGPALLAFFHARARADVDRDRLRVLLRQFAASTNQERSLATAEFLGLGPLAVPTLRSAANDLSEPEITRRASRCLKWMEGSKAATLPAAAARVLAKRKPEGAAAALLDYLPHADNSEVVRAVTSALAAVAAPDGKPDPALLRGLADRLAVRRAAAGVALSRATPPDQVPAVHKLLQDPARGVRLQTALALAEAHDAEAVPVLIDLLAELPIEQRRRVEEFLQHLAGEWAPAVNFPSEDEVARTIRRDAWAAWWRNVEGPSLLAAIRRRTVTAEDRVQIRDLLSKLSSGDFATREEASRQLLALGRRSLPQLRDAAESKDAEVARRAKLLTERIEQDPSHHLPMAALRLLSVRRPAGSVEALLAYLPFAEDENLATEVQKSLTALALRDGKLDPVLLRMTADSKPDQRIVAAEALIHGGGTQGRDAVRKLLKDDVPAVRMRVALAMALARDRDGVPVLIDLLPVLPGESVGQVEDALYQLAGDTAPTESLGTEPAEKKKCRDAWAAWWKANAERIDLGRLVRRPLLGFTLLCDPGGGRVYEIDRAGKQRWAITGLQMPVDAVVLPGSRVLIAEYQPCRVSERDFTGKILWQKVVGDNVINVQRLPNGHTFIATDSFVVEVDRAGKELYTLRQGMMYHAAYRRPNGPIVCLMQNNQCLVVDTTGRTLHNFPSNHATNMAGLDLLPNGHVLITQSNNNKVIEFDQSGKSVLELDAAGARTATGLPNGHVLVASQNNRRVYELDRAGKTVWEHKESGPVIRARRR